MDSVACHDVCTKFSSIPQQININYLFSFAFSSFNRSHSNTFWVIRFSRVAIHFNPFALCNSEQSIRRKWNKIPLEMWWHVVIHPTNDLNKYSGIVCQSFIVESKQMQFVNAMNRASVEANARNQNRYSWCGWRSLRKKNVNYLIYDKTVTVSKKKSGCRYTE